MPIKIGGLHQSSLIDYPGKICSVVFLSRCDFRCGFCHNPSLVKDEIKGVGEEEFFTFLEKRKGLIDGVCVTGGEPLINKELPDFLKKIKDMGFLVKIDTNGHSPEMLSRLIDGKLVDYVAMDIKAPLEKYPKVTNVATRTENIEKSIEIIKNSGIDYEFRTTVLPRHHNDSDLQSIAKMLKGANRFVIQQFNPKHSMDESYRKEKTHTSENLLHFKRLVSPYFGEVEIKNL